MQLDAPPSAGNGYPTFKWQNVGDVVAGEITSDPQKITTKSLDPNGGSQENLVFEVRTKGDEDFTVWVPTNKQMYRALYEAVTAAGGKLTVGSQIAIKFASTQDVGKPSPMKVYEVAYKPAVAASASVSVDDLLG